MHPDSYRHLRHAVISAAVVALLGSSLAFSTWIDHRPHDQLARPLEQIPSKVGSWSMQAVQHFPPGIEGVLSATTYIARQYAKEGTEAGLFAAYYAFQRAGETMHSPRHCLPGSGWEIWQYATVQLNVNGRSVPVNKFSIQNGASRSVAIYWYQSKNRVVADEYQAKLFQIWDGVANGSMGGSIVRVIVPDTPAQVEEGTQFATLIIPEIQRCLNAAGID